MKELKHEDLKGLCEYLNGKLNIDRYNFYRSFNFKIRDKNCKLVWFKNISTFTIDDIELRFTKIEINGNWPNSAKVNIMLGFNETVIAVIPIKE